MAKPSVAIAVLLLLLPATAAAKSDTHTVSIQGTLVDNWTIDEREPCGKVGSGTLTVRFKTVGAARTTPYIDKFQRNGKGAWIIGKLFGYKNSLIKDLPNVKVTGTISRVDNTTQHPSEDPNNPCPPPDKRGCGTSAIKKGKAGFGRRDRKSVTGDLSTQRLDLLQGCYTGVLAYWSNPPSVPGGTREGDIIVKMPGSSKLKRRGFKASGTSHKKTSFDEGRDTGTDDVTRTFNATFRKR